MLGEEPPHGHEVFRTDIHPLLATPLIDAANRNHVDTVILQDPTPLGGAMVADGLKMLGNVAGGVFELTLFATLFASLLRSFFMRNGSNFPTGGQGGNFMGMPSMQAGQLLAQKPNVSLADWAGSPEVLRECTEIVSFLRNASTYVAAGAEVPKGILLEGPPGTGKTLIAKAIATEANASFISLSASEFVEMYVGLGALKVRNLFAEARKQTPCIIFIDEIDAVGRQRGAGINMGNDEREQTLNQLLFEMDGFANNKGVIVLAATNRRDVLDAALLRPGRFDRIVNVPLPDQESRKAIFRRFLQGRSLANADPQKTLPEAQRPQKPKATLEAKRPPCGEEGCGVGKAQTEDAEPFSNTPEFDEVVGTLAEETAGLSGAQIKNVVNEAAILAARQGRTELDKSDLLQSIEKLLVGIAKEVDTRSDRTLLRVAVHEMGHAFIAALFPEYFVLKKATIQNTYSGAGGYTLFSARPELSEGGLYTRDMLQKQLVIALGGKAAETVVYGFDHVSTGASNDLKQANSLAKKMVGNFGMGAVLETYYNEETDESTPFLGRSLASGSKASQATKEQFDREVMDLVQASYEEAVLLIEDKKPLFETLVRMLEGSRTLSGAFIAECLSHAKEEEDDDKIIDL
jgi:cell division protease FtsH